MKNASFEHAPVRTIRALWRLNLNEFQCGEDYAWLHRDEIVSPHFCTRSFYLGWRYGAAQAGWLPKTADILAVMTDETVNMAVSGWVH